MTLLFVHAVPIFLVLFGVNSSPWFDRRTRAGAPLLLVRARSVKSRILVPAWATLVVWWCWCSSSSRRPFASRSACRFYHAVGYPKQVGTGWFITVIVQLVLLFPCCSTTSRSDAASAGWSRSAGPSRW